jgi:hypothetical protein
LKYDNTKVKAHIGRGQALCWNNQFAESIDVIWQSFRIWTK